MAAHRRLNSVLHVAPILLALLLPNLAAAQSNTGQPTITIAAIVLVEPTVETPMPIHVGPATALPRNSFLRIKGLPAQATFSDGHFVSAGTWALPLSSLADLKVTIPLATTGRAELQLALLAIDGSILAEARTTLAITAGTIGNIATQQPAAPPASRLPGRASLGNETAQPQPQQQPSPAVSAIPPMITRNTAPAAPVAPAPPAMRPEERERALKLHARGDVEFDGGDIAAARMLYQRAAEAGLPEAAMAMGMTFDPAELGRRGVRGLKGDPEVARKWYSRAQDLGAPGAAERISRLPR